MRSRLVIAAAAFGLAGLVAFVIPGSSRRPDVPRPLENTRAPTAEGGPLRAGNAETGARLFGSCAACHSVGRGGADLDGPNLYGVVGSGIAERRSRFAYSAALRHAGGAWSLDRLDAWLTNPAAFAPGTTMTFAGWAAAQDRADVIAFLVTQGSGTPAARP